MKKHKLVSLVAVTMTAFTIGITTAESISTVHPTEVSAASTEYRNAVAKAKSYSSISHLSKKGIYEQLRYDKFGHKAAKYGANHAHINWNRNALAKGKSYQKTMHMSKGDVKDQLKYDGFTTSQANYAINHLPK